MTITGSRQAVRAGLAGALIAVATMASLAACGGGPGAVAEPSSAAPSGVSSPVVGQVVKLDTEGLTKVRGFVLRTDDGREVSFKVGPLENAVEFPPSHLAEHMATGQAVRVSFREEGADRVVHRVEDAAEP